MEYGPENPWPSLLNLGKVTLFVGRRLSLCQIPCDNQDQTGGDTATGFAPVGVLE